MKASDLRKGDCLRDNNTGETFVIVSIEFSEISPEVSLPGIKSKFYSTWLDFMWLSSSPPELWKSQYHYDADIDEIFGGDHWTLLRK